MTTHNELMAEATQNYAMAHHYLGKLKIVLDQLSAAQSGIAQASRPPVRCVREWQDWLAANGPTLKGDIQEATGIKFTERGTPYTVEWTPSLAQEADDRFAPHTLMKINSKADGRGAPPKIYFLWSQRWDVHPLYGVGPTRPTEAELRKATDEAADRSRLSAGILYVPSELYGDEPQTVDNFNEELRRMVSEPTAVVESDAVSEDGAEPRFDSMDQWTEAWSDTLRSLAAAGTKPSDDLKQRLLDSLPDGQDGPSAIALAYSAAARNVSPLLGVVHPPETPDATADGPLDWGDYIDDIRSSE